MQGGAKRVDQLAAVMCPALPCSWWPSRKSVIVARASGHGATKAGATGHGATKADQQNQGLTPSIGKSSFGFLVSTPWLLLFLITAHDTHSPSKEDDQSRVRKSRDLIVQSVVHQAAQQPIVLTVLASNSKCVLKNDKVISDYRASALGWKGEGAI